MFKKIITLLLFFFMTDIFFSVKNYSADNNTYMLNKKLKMICCVEKEYVSGMYYVDVDSEYDTIKNLLDSGADPNYQFTKDGKQHYIFNCLVEGNSVKTAKLFIEKGAKFDEPNSYGVTPLMEAAYYGWHRIADLLLSCGADIDAKDNEGMDVFAHAFDRRPCFKKDFINTLLKYKNLSGDEAEKLVNILHRLDGDAIDMGIPTYKQSGTYELIQSSLQRSRPK